MKCMKWNQLYSSSTIVPPYQATIVSSSFTALPAEKQLTVFANLDIWLQIALLQGNRTKINETPPNECIMTLPLPLCHIVPHEFQSLYRWDQSVGTR